VKCHRLSGPDASQQHRSSLCALSDWSKKKKLKDSFRSFASFHEDIVRKKKVFMKKRIIRRGLGPTEVKSLGWSDSRQNGTKPPAEFGSGPQASTGPQSSSGPLYSNYDVWSRSVDRGFSTAFLASDERKSFLPSFLASSGSFSSWRVVASCGRY
jgi:hypothetical protein